MGLLQKLNEIVAIVHMAQCQGLNMQAHIHSLGIFKLQT